MTAALPLADPVDRLPRPAGAACEQLQPGARAARFDDAGLLIEGLRVVKLRRSSSRQRHPHPLTLCVDLDVHAPARGLRGVQRLYGKAYRQGASAAAHARALAGALAPAAFGAPLWRTCRRWTWCGGPGPTTPACPSCPR
jgi:hypothetical protein